MIRTFNAKILKIEEKNNLYHIELDQTHFSPKRDFYPGDTGFIEDSEISMVYAEKDKIFHVTSKKPIKLQRVKCTINWKDKLEFIQRYFTYNLLAFYLDEKFGASVSKFDLMRTPCILDIDKSLSEKEQNEISSFIKETIDSHFSIDCYTPSKQDFRKLKLKSVDKKLWGKVSVASIDDSIVFPFDFIPPASTGELQMFDLVEIESRGTGSRILFNVGAAAVSSGEKALTSVAFLENLLKCDVSSIESKISQLHTSVKTLQSENASLKSRVSELESEVILNSAETINSVRVICKTFESDDSKYMELLLSKLVANPDTIALFGLRSPEKTLLHFACSKNIKTVNMNSLLKDAIVLIDGNGGGSQFSAKGGGKSGNNLDSCLEYALKKVHSSL